MVEFDNVSVRYGDVVALNEFDLHAALGKTTALIGPSGCGKSTALRLVAGLVWPDSGSVRLGGEQIERANVQVLRQRMGYVIQEGGLFPHLTAKQNVCLMPGLLGRGRQETDQKVRELAELVRLPLDSLSRFPVELSGGQRQRVSLMRGLVLDPELLLLDEPLSALDPMVRASLQAELKEVFQRLGKTVLLVTHDMAEAAYLSDTIVLMDKGRVLQEGSLSDLRERPASGFVSEFLNAQRSLVVL